MLNNTSCNPMRWHTGFIRAVFVVLVVVLAACTAPPQVSSPPATSPAPEITLTIYDWPGYIPQSVLDAFAAEYGVRVDYQTYESYDEAVVKIKAGQRYDVVLIGTDFIPQLVDDQLLAEIDYQQVPNFKHISANFRDLSYDPNNTHSIPLRWGTTGLLVRTDLVKQPIRQWADLWDVRLKGQVGVWPIQRLLIGIALKSLGFSANSENPDQLEAALERLIALRANVALLDNSLVSSAPLLVNGTYVLAYGWPLDIQQARQQHPAVAYVLPEEGTLLWGDNLVIPANSPHKTLAAQFIDFLLRPANSAAITNEIFVATPNEAARSLIRPEILHDPAIFPSNSELMKAEILLPLSSGGKQLYDAIWQRYLTATT